MNLKQPIVVASNNQFKTAELVECFQFCGLQAISYFELIDKVEFPSEGTNDYQANALAKAEFIHEKLPNQIIVADDSGMILEAYPDAFGVTTARDLREYRDLTKLNQHIIELVEGHSRGVTMVSHLAVVGLDETYYGVGKFIGKIAQKPLGHNGGSFDLILTDPVSGKTLAQLPNTQKIPLLHRTKAIKDVMMKIGENR